MKKLLCSLLLFTTIFISGCGKKELTKEELLQQMLDNMQNVTSLSSKMIVDFDMEDTEEKMAIDFEIDIKIQEKSETSGLGYMDMSMKTGGIGLNFDAYLDFNETDFTMYMQNFATTNEYIKISETLNIDLTEEEQKVFNELINKKIEFDPTINELDSDIEDTRKLDITITSEEIKKILKQYEDLIKEKNSGYEEITEEDLKVIESLGNINFIIYIDSDNYLKKIEMDFTNIFSNILNYNFLGENEVKINSYKMMAEFSDYNKTTVEIPQEVIDNAVEETLEEDYYLEDYNI